MTKYRFILAFLVLSTFGIAYAKNSLNKPAITASTTYKFPVHKTNAEWQKILSPEAFHILREKGTEMAFTGKYHANHDKGTYHCAACNNLLFNSSTKFESGTGWPSFYQPATKNSVLEEVDTTYGMARTEVVCAKCGGHLGHVFDDGPKPTGLRYCMNSDAMAFKKDK